MKIEELIQNSRMVVDSTGKTEAVQIDYTLWEELLKLLESLADDPETELLSSHDQSKLKDDGGYQDGPWITEAANKVAAEVDTSLDPAISAMQRTWLSKEGW